MICLCCCVVSIFLESVVKLLWSVIIVLLCCSVVDNIDYMYNYLLMHNVVKALAVLQLEWEVGPERRYFVPVKNMCSG